MIADQVPIVLWGAFFLLGDSLVPKWFVAACVVALGLAGAPAVAAP
ncbi:MAG: hypothetical protein M3134_10500 [Actinomycetota bacterium]|nr:hypothetical protein [Actinomycetota bacterium]